MATGASEQEIDAAEQRLDVRFPADLRTFLRAQAGSTHRLGDSFVMIHDIETIVGVNLEIDGHPGFLAFASDGSREQIGLDLRAAFPPVVMIDITSAGWPDALVQAPSLGDFLDQRRRGEPLRWDVPYVTEP
jgi:cell wall assembly regulator SMI1